MNSFDEFLFPPTLQAIELRFQDVEPFEIGLGDDLLGSIQQSLSQVGGLNIKRLSANNENLVRECCAHRIDMHG